MKIGQAVNKNNWWMDFINKSYRIFDGPYNFYTFFTLNTNKNNKCCKNIFTDNNDNHHYKHHNTNNQSGDNVYYNFTRGLLKSTPWIFYTTNTYNDLNWGYKINDRCNNRFQTDSPIDQNHDTREQHIFDICNFDNKTTRFVATLPSHLKTSICIIFNSNERHIFRSIA